MAKLRTQNQLQQTSDEELKKLAAKSGAPIATSPATAVAQGAGPDSAKMAGSSAQRFANVSVKPDQTLGTADRQDKARTEQTQSEQAVAGKAGQLDALSGLDLRVKAAVQNQFKNVQNTQPTATSFNEEALTSLGVSDQAGLTALLQQYSTLVNTSPASPELNQVLAQLANTYGVTNPDELINTSASATGNLAADAIMNPDQVTLGSLDVTELGYTPEQLAELVGPDYANLSIPQFSQRLEDMRAEEMSRVAGLRAQLNSLPPGSAQRSLLLQELGDLANVGVTGMEQGVDRLQSQIDSADQVTFAGRTFTVDKLLADDNVSSIVAEYLNPSADPAWKQKLEAENPEFAAWINENQEGLKQLANGMLGAQEQFGTLQEEQAALATVGDGVTLSDDVMKAIIPDWGKSVASVSDLSENAVYQALVANPELANKVDTKTIKELEGLTTEEIAEASAAGDALTADADLAAILDLEGGAFITDPKAREAVAELKPLIDKLRAEGGAEVDTFLAQSEFQNLIKSGELNEDNIDEFLANPESFNDWTKYNTLLKDFAAIETGGDLNEIVGFLFGNEGVDLDTVNNTYQDLRLAAKDPRNKKAIERLKIFEQLDSNPKDGKLDVDDAPNFLSTIKKGLGSLGFDDAVAGKTKDSLGFANTIGKKAEPGVKPDGLAFMEMIKEGINARRGKRLDYNSLTGGMKPRLDEILAMPASWKKQYLDPRFDTKEEIESHRQEILANKLEYKYDKSMPSISAGRIKNVKGNAGIGIWKELNKVEDEILRDLDNPLLTPAEQKRAKQILKDINAAQNRRQAYVDDRDGSKAKASALVKKRSTWDTTNANFITKIQNHKAKDEIGEAKKVEAAYAKWKKENKRP